MKIGYARVSSYGQKLDVQLERLKSAECEKVFQEKVSGKDATTRKELQAALDYVREGDCFVVTKLDRLARSVQDLVSIAKRLEEAHVDLVVLDQSIDTSTPTGRLMFHMLAAIGEFERELIQERAQEGRVKAREAGIQFGRPSKLTNEQLDRLRQEFNTPGIIKTELASRYGVSKSSLYRLVKM